MGTSRKKKSQAGVDEAIARERREAARALSRERAADDAVEETRRREKLEAGPDDAPHREERRRETVRALEREETRADQDRARAARDEDTDEEIRRGRGRV